MKLTFAFSSETRRRQLEIALTVVLSAALTVVASRFIEPDPSKLAANAVLTPLRERSEPASVRPASHPPSEVDPAFMEALQRGDLAAVEKLYRPGMPLNDTLFTAAGSGNEAVVRFLLDRGVDVHEGESSATAPILEADDTPAIVALLLERGARKPLLGYAARAGAVNMVDTLVREHAPLDPESLAPLAEALTSQRMTPSKKKVIVEKLLEAGANPNHGSLGVDDEGEIRPLTLAARSCVHEREEEPPLKTVGDCLPLIDALVKHGARANGEALVAAMAVDEEVLDLMLTRMEPGSTAVALAHPGFNYPTSPPLALVKKIVAKGVDWGFRDGENEEALPLIAALERRDRDVVALLIASGAPVNRAYKNGDSPLAVVIRNLSFDDAGDNARLLELLIAKGADVNRRLPDGRTPLHAVATTGNLRAIHALLDAGARVNDPVLYETALDAAEEAGQIPAARVINAAGGVRLRFNANNYGHP